MEKLFYLVLISDFIYSICQLYLFYRTARPLEYYRKFIVSSLNENKNKQKPNKQTNRNLKRTREEKYETKWNKNKKDSSLIECL